MCYYDCIKFLWELPSYYMHFYFFFIYAFLLDCNLVFVSRFPKLLILRFHKNAEVFIFWRLTKKKLQRLISAQAELTTSNDKFQEMLGCKKTTRIHTATLSATKQAESNQLKYQTDNLPHPPPPTALQLNGPSRKTGKNQSSKSMLYNNREE